MDALRHCPSNVDDIIRYKKFCESKIEKLKHDFQNEKNEEAKDKLRHEIDHFNTDIWTCSRRIEMRNLLPNVPNYEELGFKRDVSNYLLDNYGSIAWHFYQKQFENALLKSVVEQLQEPVILDLGGGMAISLEKDYEILDKKFRELNPKLYNENFNLHMIGFKHIKKALKPFKNVIYLSLPDNYLELKSRARKDNLNEIFISTGQYNELASKIVDTTGLLGKTSFDEDILNKILDTILSTNPKKIIEKELSN